MRYIHTRPIKSDSLMYRVNLSTFESYPTTRPPSLFSPTQPRAPFFASVCPLHSLLPQAHMRSVDRQAISGADGYSHVCGFQLPSIC